MNFYECFLAEERGMIYVYASGGMVVLFHEFQIVCVRLTEERQFCSLMSAMKRSRTAHALRAQICHVDQPLASKKGSSPQTDDLQDW